MSAAVSRQVETSVGPAAAPSTAPRQMRSTGGPAALASCHFDHGDMGAGFAHFWRVGRHISMQLL